MAFEERIYCDAQNLAYEYNWHIHGERKFSYESLPLIVNTGEKCYGLETILILPKHILEKKWKIKCGNEDIVNEIVRLRNSGKIIKVGNKKEEDDVAVIDYALKHGSFYSTFDKNYSKFVDQYRNNERMEEFLVNKRIEILFQGKELIFKTMPFKQEGAS